MSGAVGVAASKNIMHSCVYLLASLLGVAGLYITLGADFVGVVQLVVYVGGVVVLMVFAVMLTGGAKEKTNRRGPVKIPSMGNRRTFITALFCVLVAGLSVYRILQGVFKESAPAAPDTFESTVDKLGILLVTDHVLAFEIVSVLLLGALIGAAMIARPERRNGD